MVTSLTVRKSYTRNGSAYPGVNRSILELRLRILRIEEGAVGAPSRSVTLLRAGVGAVLAAFPGRVASAAEGHPATPRACLFTRVLGVRHLTQATLTLVAPQLLTPVRAALVDGLHTATAMLLAARSPRHRRPL
jgi:hypothetical protein